MTELPGKMPGKTGKTHAGGKENEKTAASFEKIDFWELFCPNTSTCETPQCQLRTVKICLFYRRKSYKNTQPITGN
jgi:hypothetical protein